MNPYICKYKLVHDKPCIPANENGKVVLNPSSNNGWTYAAYLNAVSQGGYATSDAVFYACQKDRTQDPIYHTYRLPEKKFPPISRDEIIGMISLGYDPLKGNEWFMYEQPGKLRFKHYWEAVMQLIEISGKHRNYFWENEMYDTFPVAMKLWWHDRHYIINKHSGDNVPFYWIMFQLYAWSTILFGTYGEKNLLWLQLKDLKSKFLIKFLNYKKNFRRYFPMDHPIVLTIYGKSYDY